MKTDKQVLVGCYYFPNYHVDKRNKKLKGSDWTEWELVKKAKPRFEGHFQPKEPLWGHLDESDPYVMAQKIDAAANHAIDAFVFDWYWYEGRPYLHRCLEEGFLKAHNRGRMNFALMWANHDWVDIHPASSPKTPPLIFPGSVDDNAFDNMTDYIVERYFSHPNYLKINNCPYFSIYELFRLVSGLGGVENTKEALTKFRKKTVKAGFKGLHLNAVTWGVQILPQEKTVSNTKEMLDILEFNSATTYVWIHQVYLDQFPKKDYLVVLQKYLDYAKNVEVELGIPYFPNVTMGWDSSPRAEQSEPFENTGYPFMSTIVNNTPENFGKAMVEVKNLICNKPQDQRIVLINCWNEWTEGSYLEPDRVHGMAYLEAVKKVFS